MVDRDLVLRRLADLDLYRRQVAEYGGVSPEEYGRDWKTQRIVERTLQMAIEACLDIGNHLIVDQKLRVPNSYSDVFQVLAEARILSDGERDSMVHMAGFRNLLVH